jgi:hypothetical protein
VARRESASVVGATRIDRCPPSLRFELCLVKFQVGPGFGVGRGDVERWSAAMPEKNLPSVGDRVNVDGGVGAFFVLYVNWETHSASLLPSDNGPILDQLPVGAMTLLPRPGPNGASTA